MQVSFNPYITNQQQVKQPTHKAVIQKYVDVAKKDVKKYNKIYTFVLRSLMDDVLFSLVTPIDAIDTLEKIKKIAPNGHNTIDYYIDILKKEL